MSGSAEVNAPHDRRLILKHGVRFHCCPIPAEATVACTVFCWCTGRRLFEFPDKGPGRGGMKQREFLCDVIDADASGEGVGAGCARMEILASRGVREEAKPSRFEDYCGE